MQHLPTLEWLQRYEFVKQKLSSPTDFNRYFDSAEICEKRLLRTGKKAIPIKTSMTNFLPRSSKRAANQRQLIEGTAETGSTLLFQTQS
ncbi:MAG: hypothetical protein LBJ04_09650 [Sphingobacterium sp.]|jgi:hypothetical protein|nr:hypothetical protein [Sphingobacterium sp.]